MKYFLLVCAMVALTSCSNQVESSICTKDCTTILTAEEQGYPLYIYEEDKNPEATLTGAVKYEFLKIRFSRSVFNPDTMQYEDMYSYQVVEWPYYRYRITFQSGSVGYYYNQPHIDWPTELLLDEKNIKNIVE